MLFSYPAFDMSSTMIPVVVIFTYLFCVYGRAIQDERNTFDMDPFVISYKEKICGSEKTCHLVNTVPESFRNLTVRNCMCDSECSKYGDCCEDSNYLYVNQNQNTTNIEWFHCPPIERIYMKTYCPSNYTNRSVKGKCESSARPLKNENKKIYIPVTNTRANITYGNEYCAICNNDYTYKSWNLTARCWIVHDASQRNTTRRTRNVGRRSRDFETVTQVISSAVESPTTEYIDWYAVDLEEAKKRIQFNPENQTFFSEYKDKVYHCQYQREIPNDLRPHFRDCVPAISNCTNKNDPLLERCRSYTSIVYDELQVAYRNVDCARCNGVTNHLYGCTNPNIKITGSSIFTTSDKNSGRPPPCNSAKIKEKFC